MTPPDCADYAAMIAQTIFPNPTPTHDARRQELQYLLIAFANEIRRRTLEP